MERVTERFLDQWSNKTSNREGQYAPGGDQQCDPWKVQ